ncbi:hypothetical protein [Aquimarina litoralis]
MFCFFFFSISLAYGQKSNSEIWTEEHEFIEENDQKRDVSSFLFSKYNFKNMLSNSYPNYQNDPAMPMNGIFGKDYEKIEIFFTEVSQSENPQHYMVEGKSNLKGVICKFKGMIKLDKADLYYGDRELEVQRIIIKGTYKFEELRSEPNSGIFQGGIKIICIPLVPITEQKIVFDLNAPQEEGVIRGFVGTWTSHQSSKQKKCLFGFYRFPYKFAPDFDLGAGESVINLKYAKTWFDYTPKEWKQIYQKIKNGDFDSGPHIYQTDKDYGIHINEPVYKYVGKDEWYLR